MTFPEQLPAARTPSSRAAPSLRWAVMGPGWIAGQFVESLQARTGQEIVAVGSRDLGRAKEFGRRFGIATAVGSYQDLVALPGVDIVYVATPHPSHLDHALLSMEAGKHVLVEKPIAMSAAQARQIAATAEAAGRYCAEALWTLYQPKWDVLRQIIDAGVLGELRSVHASYGEFFPAGHRIFDPALAGGPLLDLGTYPLAFITSLLGAAESVAAAGAPDPRGVNGMLGATMLHQSGAMSVFSTTVHGWTRNELTIIGSEGTAVVEAMHNCPGPIVVSSADRSIVLRHDEPHGDHVEGLHYQAAEAARRITDGETWTPLRPLSDSITMLEASDEIRRQVGIRFDAAGLRE